MRLWVMGNYQMMIITDKEGVVISQHREPLLSYFPENGWVELCPESIYGRLH